MSARIFVQDTIASAGFISAMIYGKEYFFPQKFEVLSETIITKEQIKEKFREDIDRSDAKIREMADRLKVKNMEIYYNLDIFTRDASMSRLKDKNVLCVSLV